MTTPASTSPARDRLEDLVERHDDRPHAGLPELEGEAAVVSSPGIAVTSSGELLARAGAVRVTTTGP